MVIVVVVLLSMLAGAAWWALHQALPLKDERVEVATSAGTNPPLYYALVGGLARLVGGADDTGRRSG